MAEFTMTVDNLAGFKGRFRAHKIGMALQVNRITKGIADDIVIVAQDLVATDEFKTRDSIRSERRGKDWVVVADRFGDRPGVPIFLELGTWKMAARPFMQPAGQMVLASRGFSRAATRVGGLLGSSALT